MPTLCCRNPITPTPGAVKESDSYYTALHDRDGPLVLEKPKFPTVYRQGGRFIDQKSRVVKSKGHGVVGLADWSRVRSGQ